MAADIAIVIPCYNEEARLDPAAILPLLGHPRVRLILVDDGSSDGTRSVLAALAARQPGRMEVLGLPRNCGKAEAVRAGLGHALAAGAAVVGYVDADMSTPADEVLRLVDTLESTSAQAVIGARVAVLGADIRRKHTRHYLGRVFATFASLVLRAPIYDTQCGAKLFRASAELGTAVDEPFRSRWAFDVELLGRLMVQAGNYRAAGIIEVPLRRWVDVDGSKVQPAQAVRAGLDLGRIAVDLERLRRRQR